MKTVELKNKDKQDLIKKVSKLYLSKKENNLFGKILVKGIKDWNDNDIEFLTSLYDLHYYPILSAGGMDIYPWAQTEEIRRETEAKKEKAIIRLTKEPYSLWFKNSRNYK
jgi:hypothetical protein